MSAFPMRHNQKLTYEQLRDEAAEAVRDYAGTQTELAEELGVSRAAISRAIRESGPTLAALQVRLLELLKEEYELEKEEQVWFRVRRKE